MNRYEFDGPVRRNLLMHIWPSKGWGAWQWNCDQILRRATLFNGRRIVAIATSADADPPEAVQEYLRDLDAEFIIVENDREYREVVTFLPLLGRVASEDRNDVTFYCHSKGCRHRATPDEPRTTVFRWTEAMYEVCLDDWPAVAEALQASAMAGAFRRHGMFALPGNHRWHYSGTFFWFRNQDVFTRGWNRVDQRRYGAEAWPGRMFKAEETSCLMLDHCQNMYSLPYFDNVVQRAWDAWRLTRK